MVPHAFMMNSEHTCELNDICFRAMSRARFSYKHRATEANQSSVSIVDMSEKHQAVVAAAAVAAGREKIGYVQRYGTNRKRLSTCNGRCIHGVVLYEKGTNARKLAKFILVPCFTVQHNKFCTP